MLEGWGEIGIVLDIMGQQRVTFAGYQEGVHDEGVIGWGGVHTVHHFRDFC